MHYESMTLISSAEGTEDCVAKFTSYKSYELIPLVMCPLDVSPVSSFVFYSDCASSEWAPVSSRIPQATVQCPLLFSYISD